MFKGKKYKKLFNLETENNPKGPNEVSTAKGATSNSQRHVDFEIFCVMPSGLSSQDDLQVTVDRNNASIVEKCSGLSTTNEDVSTCGYGNIKFDLKGDKMDVQNDERDNWGIDFSNGEETNGCDNVDTEPNSPVTSSVKNVLCSTLEGILFDDCSPDHELECLLDSDSPDPFQSSPVHEGMQCNSDCPWEEQVDISNKNVFDPCDNQMQQELPDCLPKKDDDCLAKSSPLPKEPKVAFKPPEDLKPDWKCFNTLMDAVSIPTGEDKKWFAWRDKTEDRLSVPNYPSNNPKKGAGKLSIEVTDEELFNAISKKPRKSLSEDNLSFLSSSKRIEYPCNFNNSSVIADCFKIDRNSKCHYTDITSAASILTSAASLPRNSRLQKLKESSPERSLKSTTDLIASLDDLKLWRFEHVRDDSCRPKQNFDRMKRLLNAFRPNLRYSSLDKTSRREKGIPTEALNISLVDVYKFSRQYLETLSESKIRDSERYEARRMAVCEDRDDSRDDFLYLLRMYLQRRHLLEYQYL